MVLPKELKARLHYDIQLNVNSTAIADKELGPKSF